MTNDNYYRLLPIRFKPAGNKLLLTTEAGDFHFVSTTEFDDILGGSLSEESKLFQDLKSKDFLATSKAELIRSIDMSSTRYRSRKRFLSDFTSLHMMVVTLRCNQRCEYCQVSCEDDVAYKYDMKPDVARKIVDYIFMSPSSCIKIEFQGGEPLLNWETVKSTIEYAELKNKSFNKNLDFVLCTNLTLIDENKLLYLKEHNVDISTSLDGTEGIHDANRVLRTGGGTYRQFIEKLSIARDICGHDKIGALMTTTSVSVDDLRPVVDEYIRLGFNGVFFRALNPYGFASDNDAKLGYNIDRFVDSYKKGLEYIIELNLSGKTFVEYYTLLLLTRILTPFSTGFVDLQSPSGAGISGVIYDYNGDVYPADEGRMLARMDDQKFLMGNVFTHSYSGIFEGEVLKDIVSKSCLEVMPGCSDCAYHPYCGADPVRNYLETGDVVGARPISPFCQKHMGIFDYLFSLIEEDRRDVMDVFWSWITRLPLKEVRGEDD
ncbi:His-Xaa-Ser system radical SAM maturase HxsB [Pseudodesulfovibrio methanolicus]|uniref:His-Xaa-Ser system radical SAM maturase HxsB n=1 Tax=Pseudodesulfovibrio methanolicus TaxID=3126690 RepID=A0ABZ2IQW1_9BACT